VAKVTMTLTGMNVLQSALVKAPDQVQVRAGDAVLKTGFAIAQRARTLVPVRTGRLKGAIASATRGTSGRVGLSGGPEVHYWRYVEFGTRYMPARPFFRPAADAESTGFVDRIRAIGPALERDLSTSRLV